MKNFYLVEHESAESISSSFMSALHSPPDLDSIIRRNSMKIWNERTINVGSLLLRFIPFSAQEDSRPKRIFHSKVSSSAVCRSLQTPTKLSKPTINLHQHEKWAQLLPFFGTGWSRERRARRLCYIKEITRRWGDAALRCPLIMLDVLRIAFVHSICQKL